MLSCFAPKTKWVRTAPKQLLEGRKQPSEGVVGSIWAPLVADGGCSHLLSYFEFLCKGLKHVIKNTWTILDPTFHRIDAKPDLFSVSEKPGCCFSYKETTHKFIC